MSNRTLRVPPLQDEQLDAQAKEALTPFASQGRVLNIFRTLAHHPELLRRWRVFANHVMGKSTLNERDRELLILRIGYLCGSEYEWGQHVAIARRAGISAEEIAAVKQGSSAASWSAQDRLLLQAAEDLRTYACIQDNTWAGLQAFYNTQQMIDIIFTVGQYNLVSMALNSLGVPLDEGVRGFE